MIYLVRQAETDWNLFRRANGVTDTFLNRTGIAQAQRQAENLREVAFDACYCSPQTRARQTCEIVYHGLVVFDDRLVELDCGDFEGADETDADMMRLFWQAVMSGEKGAENFSDFMQRNCDFCNMVVERHPGENVLVVTHAGNVRVMDYYFKGKPTDYDFKARTIVKSGGLLTFENAKN